MVYERAGSVVSASATFYVDGDSYYIVGQTIRCGFSDRQLRLFKVTDTGSGFTLDQSFNLSDISNSPTKFFDWYTDSFVVHEASSSIFRFSLLTDSGNAPLIASYEIQNPNDTNPTISLVATFQPFNSDSGGYMEMTGSGENLYLAKSLGGDDSDIRVMKLDSSLGVIWDKQIDVLSSGYTDIFGGMTEDPDGGVAITGRYRESSSDDDNGFILLLDSNGE